MSKTRIVAHLFLIWFCSFLTSCASGPDKPGDFKPAPDGPAGYATLYIFRPYDVIGKDRAPTTYVNGSKIIDLKSASYTAVYIKPGQYHIDTKDGSLLSNSYNNIAADIEITSVGDYYLSLEQVSTYDSGNVGTAIGAAVGGAVGGVVSTFVAPGNGIASLKWTLTTNRYDKMRIRDCYYLQPDLTNIPAK